MTVTDIESRRRTTIAKGNPLAGYGSGIRKETLLGWVAWYGISDPKVEFEALKQKFEDLGLDEAALPAPLRPGDSFKRACRYGQQSKIPIPGQTDQYANILIRKVAMEADLLEWHMVVETVDQEGKRLGYDEVAALRFHKTKNELEIDRTDFSRQRGYAQLCNRAIAVFRQEFEDAQTYIDSQTLRQVIRRQLDIMRAFLLRRNGSVYFLPLLEWMGNGSGFHILPLIDTEKQREMIQGAFEDEVHESAQKMLGDLQEALTAKKPITNGQWLDMLDRKDKLYSRAREYSDLIDREFAKAGTELALLDDSMTELLKQALIKEPRGKKAA
jgi:hypothetical protein